jgi:hypothetical protein
MVLQFWDEVYGFALVGVDNLGVDLRCADVGVAKELGDSVEVGSVGEGEGCEGVAADMERDWLFDAGVLDEGVQTGIGIARLVGHEVEYPLVVRGTVPLRNPFQGVVGEREEEFLLGLLHLGLQLDGAVATDFEFAPGHLVDVGVAEAGEACEEEGFLHVVIGSVRGCDYLLDLFEGEVAAGVLFGAGLELGVDFSAGVLDDDAFSFGFVEGDHDAGKERFFVDSAQGSGFVDYAALLLIEVVVVVVEVVDEAEEVFFVYAVEGDVGSFVVYETADGAPHEGAAGSLAVGFVGIGHLLEEDNKVVLACPAVVFEAEAAVEELLHAVNLGSVGEGQLFFVVLLVFFAIAGTQVDLEELVCPYPSKVYVQVGRLTSIKLLSAIIV